MQEGTRIRDDIVNSLFALRVKKRDSTELGACIDGYPKSDSQIGYLRNTLRIEPTFVFVLECSERLLMDRQKILDLPTGKKYTLLQAKESGDYKLLSRLTQIANESKQALHNRIENWDMTKRSLLKTFESKVVTINIEGLDEAQIVDKVIFMIGKARV